MRVPDRSHPLDYLFVLRPVLMPPVWTIFLLGHAFRATRLPQVLSLDLIMVFLLLFWLCGAVYLLNQYFDVASDRLNRKLFFLSHDLISRPSALYYYLFLNLAALTAALAVSWQITLLVLLAVGLGLAYSAPPLRLKDRPYAALLTNALGHGVLVFMFGWVLSGGRLLEGLINSLPYALAVGSIYILTTIPDTAGDQRVGKRTLAVTLGPQRSARWALGWYWAAVLLAFYTTDLLFLLAALPLAYLYIRAASGEPTRAARTVRWAVGLLSLVACIYYPWYLLLLVAGFLGTRRYYRWRFDLAYP